MMIIGCDLHTRYQQVAMVDTETGELLERRLEGAGPPLGDFDPLNITNQGEGVKGTV